MSDEYRSSSAYLRYMAREWHCPQCGQWKRTAEFRGPFKCRSTLCADCRDQNARASINLRLRFEILRRDNFTCQYCGHSAPDVKLQIDHIRPVARGGTNHPDNLVTACELCNAGKSDSEID